MNGGCEQEEPSPEQVALKLAEDLSLRRVRWMRLEIEYVDGRSEVYDGELLDPKEMT